MQFGPALLHKVVCVLTDMGWLWSHMCPVIQGTSSSSIYIEGRWETIIPALLISSPPYRPQQRDDSIHFIIVRPRQ
jgi:hypothetical protein